MATNYPGSLDTSTQQPSPSASTEMDDAGYEHDVVHTNHSGAIIALETKLGTGSSTAAANSVLAGTGSGTSGWTTTPTVVDLTATGNVDITGTLAVDGIVTLGDEIKGGSGSAADPVFTFASDGDTGMYSAGTNALGFTTGGTSRFVIDSSGNVGINDTTPSYKLDVNGTARFTDQVYVQSILNVTNDLKVDTDTLFVDVSADRVGINDSTPSYSLDVNGTGRFTGNLTAQGDLYVGKNGGGDSRIYFYDDNSNANRTFMWDDSANRFYFSNAIAISGTQLSDPGSSNNLRVTTAYGYLDLGPQNSTYCHIYTDRGKFYLNKGINSAPHFFWRDNSGIGGPLTDTSTGTGYRYVFQNQTYGTFFDYSSIRARKEQIVNVTEADAGRWIDALQPVTFIERWMGEGEEPADNKAFREADMQVGFIADDILDNPDTIHFSQVLDNGEGGFDPAGWKWECVIATCVAELKASRAREAALEARVAALEAA